MSVGPEALLADPVFQLNVVLWLVQPLPEAAPVNPVLHRAGYELHAVGPPLPSPGSVRSALFDLVGSADAPRPDVVLSCRDHPTMLVVECKAQGFGPDSSTARQALKLLAVSVDLAGPLALPPGSPRPGYVAYLTVAPAHRELPATLTSLQSHLTEAALEPAPAGTLGLETRDDGVWLNAVEVDTWPQPAADALAEPAQVLHLAPGDDDPRPLYLIPWDPGVQGGQDADLASFGKAMLGARILNAAKSVIGRADVPGPLVVRIADLLRDATLGVSEFWRDRDDFRSLVNACQKFVFDALRPVATTISLVIPPQPDFLQLTLGSDEAQAGAIAALHAGLPGSLEAALEQLSLFDAP